MNPLQELQAAVVAAASAQQARANSQRDQNGADLLQQFANSGTSSLPGAAAPTNAQQTGQTQMPSSPKSLDSGSFMDGMERGFAAGLPGRRTDSTGTSVSQMELEGVSPNGAQVYHFREHGTPFIKTSQQSPIVGDVLREGLLRLSPTREASFTGENEPGPTKAEEYSRRMSDQAQTEARRLSVSNPNPSASNSTIKPNLILRLPVPPPGAGSTPQTPTTSKFYSHHSTGPASKSPSTFQHLTPPLQAPSSAKYISHPTPAQPPPRRQSTLPTQPVRLRLSAEDRAAAAQEEYDRVLQVMLVLRQQLEQADKDIETLEMLKKKAQEDPITFAESIVNGTGPRLPAPIPIARVPIIDYSKFQGVMRPSQPANRKYVPSGQGSGIGLQVDPSTSAALTAAQTQTMAKIEFGRDARVKTPLTPFKGADMDTSRTWGDSVVGIDGETMGPKGADGYSFAAKPLPSGGSAEQGSAVPPSAAASTDGHPTTTGQKSSKRVMAKGAAPSNAKAAGGDTTASKNSGMTPTSTWSTLHHKLSLYFADPAAARALGVTPELLVEQVAFEEKLKRTREEAGLDGSPQSDVVFGSLNVSREESHSGLTSDEDDEDLGTRGPTVRHIDYSTRRTRTSGGIYAPKYKGAMTMAATRGHIDMDLDIEPEGPEEAWDGIPPGAVARRKEDWT
ncbi:hypothetical protein HDU93_001827, partial [Gonapodya sp. JEL0774]